MADARLSAPESPSQSDTRKAPNGLEHLLHEPILWLRCAASSLHSSDYLECSCGAHCSGTQFLCRFLLLLGSTKLRFSPSHFPEFSASWMASALGHFGFTAPAEPLRYARDRGSRATSYSSRDSVQLELVLSSLESSCAGLALECAAEPKCKSPRTRYMGNHAGVSRIASSSGEPRSTGDDARRRADLRQPSPRVAKGWYQAQKVSVRVRARKRGQR